jgi:hypothetical protein
VDTNPGARIDTRRFGVERPGVERPGVDRYFFDLA